MNKNSIFSFLLPKENKFFPLINHVGELNNSASVTLNKFINSKDKTEMKDLYFEIKAYEREADDVLSVIFEELNSTFITPFDREDIHELCERLDDTLDNINSASKRVLLFQPKNIPDSMLELCKIIGECGNAINISLQELKTVNKKPTIALEQCERLHLLERKGDEVYEQYIKHLFEVETDSIELFKTKEIMQELERTTDAANAVGKVIKTIIVKYA